MQTQQVVVVRFEILRRPFLDTSPLGRSPGGLRATSRRRTRRLDRLRLADRLSGACSLGTHGRQDPPDAELCERRRDVERTTAICGSYIPYGAFMMMSR